MPFTFLDKNGNYDPTGSHVPFILRNTDWALLAQQKLALLHAIHVAHDHEQTQGLQGLLNFIDALQDAARLDGFPVVFLTDEEAEDCDV